MSDKKGWGATVLGWFVVSDDDEGQAAEEAAARPVTGRGDAAGVREGPPAAVGGEVNFAPSSRRLGSATRRSAGCPARRSCWPGLPGETPAPVKSRLSRRRSPRLACHQQDYRRRRRRDQAASEG